MKDARRVLIAACNSTQGHVSCNQNYSATLSGRGCRDSPRCHTHHAATLTLCHQCHHAVTLTSSHTHHARDDDAPAILADENGG